MTSSQQDDRPQRNQALAWREADGEVFITATEGDRLYTLSEIGAAIWRACDGSKTTDEIVDGLMEEYEIDRPTLAADVAEYVEELRKTGLLD